jgi:hypothetical protein
MMAASENATLWNFQSYQVFYLWWKGLMQIVICISRDPFPQTPFPLGVLQVN